MADQDPNISMQQEVLAQLVRAMGQQQQLAGQVPQANNGFLEPGQSGIMDAVTNPSQAQLNAGIAGVLGAFNPRSNAPIATGLATGLSALVNERGRDLATRQAAYKAQTDSLQQRIENLSSVSDISNKISKYGLDKEALNLDTHKFDYQRGQDQRQLAFDVARQSQLVEDTVGQDEFGNPIKAQFSFNPVTGQRTQITSGTSGTTQAHRGEVKELSAKTSNALKEGARLFFDPDLHQIFGPTEMRPLLGKLTEGRIAGKAKKLEGNYNRFVQDRVLDVARVLAPVTDLDVEQLKATLAPQKALGNAEEAREWFVGAFVPKVMNTARFNASPVAAMQIGQGFIEEGLRSGMSEKDVGAVLGEFPSVDEVRPFVDEVIFTPFSDKSPLAGKAIPMSVVKGLARAQGVSVGEYVESANLRTAN